MEKFGSPPPSGGGTGLAGVDFFQIVRNHDLIKENLSQKEVGDRFSVLKVASPRQHTKPVPLCCVSPCVVSPCVVYHVLYIII